MFDLHRLRLLRELKLRGTLAAVATALAYSPSSVSQQLSQLEREVGVKLLEPVGRRVRLTAQAEILVGHVEAVLERLERAEAELALSLTEVSGTLRVASFQTAALALLPPALTTVRDTLPRLRVHVTQAEPEEALPALLTHDFDMVLSEEYPGSPIPRPAELEQEELCDDPLRLAHPALSPSDSPQEALRSLADRPWVMEPEGTPARHRATTLCRDAGFEPDVRFESSDLLLHLRLAERGHAAAMLPDLLWHGFPPTLPLHDLPYGQHHRKLIIAVRRGGSRHPAVAAFRQALQEAVSGRTPGTNGAPPPG
ncbi:MULTISPECIES: LysR family transcriptional regulator [unclassified Streptomyces]|uniref:LysR family transcriptional regulator n=1 Tax=unclassified Streptomyces TaxID=2593676 RepID=UPI002DDC36BA|nr:MULTISPECIES: LysR family transcriptional regulator [unclassified Streptomyces]WSA91817.1 LysR family transcriptional regulator [Streptomyces sp. NBC_01795]WSB76187.1 LysR family transcriptional regulator [Streptomyces sp. NBC_01775]WSS15539.1 LysR family transcriptional regulator [Streptomyces sp. NBC_01186]WSS44380.1 LysR family transcriptional regulator [Streptomyces sp. NBC_01187]